MPVVLVTGSTEPRSIRKGAPSCKAPLQDHGTPFGTGRRKNSQIPKRPLEALRTGRLMMGSSALYSYKLHGTSDTGRRVGAGVYLYTLRAGNRTTSRLMTLLR